MTTSRSAAVGAGASHLLRSYHAGLPDLRILRVREDVAGSGPGPRCAGGYYAVKRALDAALPGFGPGPRCATQQAILTAGAMSARCRGPAPALVARRRCRGATRSTRHDIAGVRPGPRCARYKFRARPSTAAGVAGVRPPALVERASGTRASRKNSWRRCRGSAPALVARSSRRPGARWTTRHRGTLPGFTSGPCCAWPMEDGTGSGQLGRCRGSAPALVARGSPRTRRSVASGRRYRGLSPALVARTRATTPTRSSPLRHCRGSGPRPSLRAVRVDRHRHRRGWTLPGLRPRPWLRERVDVPAGDRGGGRCRGSAPALVARSGGRSASARRRRALPGVRPRPSLRDRPAPAELLIGPSVAGVRPRPSLRDSAGHPEDLLGHDVAGVRPRPSLRGDGRSRRPVHGMWRCRGRSRPALRGDPGPVRPRLPDRRCRVQPRPWLRV